MPAWQPYFHRFPYSLTEQDTMRTLSTLALVCAALCSGCSTMETTPLAAMPEGRVMQAEPRGIIGEPCPPALAAKAYC